MGPWALIEYPRFSHRGLWPRVTRAGPLSQASGSHIGPVLVPHASACIYSIQSGLVSAKAKEAHTQMHSSFISAGWLIGDPDRHYFSLQTGSRSTRVLKVLKLCAAALPFIIWDPERGALVEGRRLIKQVKCGNAVRLIDRFSKCTGIF